MFDLQTRALRLQQREEGAEWGSSGRLRLYTLDADACKQVMTEDSNGWLPDGLPMAF